MPHEGGRPPAHRGSCKREATGDAGTATRGRRVSPGKQTTAHTAAAEHEQLVHCDESAAEERRRPEARRCLTTYRCADSPVGIVKPLPDK